MSEKRRGRPPKHAPVTTAFSTYVRGVMRQLALDESALADRLKVSTKTIYAWLSGQDPRLPDLVKLGISAALGIALAGEVAAPSVQSPRSSLTALEGAMAKDRSLRKAMGELHEIYMARNVDPAMWADVRAALTRIHELMQRRRADSQGKRPAKVRPTRMRRQAGRDVL